MIKLLDGYYIKGEANCYVLTQEIEVKNKKQYKPIAYYITIPDVITGLIKLKSREYINNNDLQTINDLKKYQEDLLEKIKIEIGTLEGI